MLDDKRIIKKVEDTNKAETNEASEKRERMLIWLLINSPEETYSVVYNQILPDNVKNEKNRKIVTQLYEEYKSGNSNINSVLDTLDQDDVNYVTGIASENFEITDINKGISDILLAYEKEKLVTEKENIIKRLDNSNLTSEESVELEGKLNQIIIKLAKLKKS